MNYLYIHLMEMSPYPEIARQAADRLRLQMPDAGHMAHMATHIDNSRGTTGAPLPTGSMIIGSQFDDATVLRVAYTYEQAVGGFPAPPALATIGSQS